MSRVSRHKRNKHRLKVVLSLLLSCLFIFVGITAVWLMTLQIPDIDSFANRKISSSTKIYDRTGNVLLFDTGADAKRTVIALEDMSPFIPKATISIEDSNFYNNIGIEPTAILRAVITDVLMGGYEQGASTITQQVIKNSLLTTDKTITRKIKEWVLAIKLTKVMSKDQILQTYLNETSYGGTIYGVEAASQQFFGVPAKEVTLAQASYLAAIPQAPTFFSPYGTHQEALKRRANLVLTRMLELGVINKTQYDEALAEKVTFLSKNSGGIKAPHFVMYVRDYLVNKYGEDLVYNGGLRVITTLDYDMQQTAEDVVTKYAESLATNFNASNTAMIALNPQNGDVLAMVGSKDYFDPEIDGNYNVTLAARQPGSTFKPFVYAAMFRRGFTPETVLWDVKTEFSTLCNPDGTPKNPQDDPKDVCYSPGEYDDIFDGPIIAKKALAQSRNIPAVQALHLAGIPQTVRMAEEMGMTITNVARCGLTLVLGGCEVSLIDLAGAYGVFANDGIRNQTRIVLEVKNRKGETLEEPISSPVQVIQPEIARNVNDILSDRNIRMNSLKPIGDSVGRPVAIKTGTTNDYKDVWTMGYTPNLVIGAWAGNNDNVPMQRNIAGLIISPLWGAFMSQTVKNFPNESFNPPPTQLTDGKPVLRGVWQGGISYWKDKISGKVATEYTPKETREEIVFPNVHSTLFWADKDDPRGPSPMEKSTDSQFPYWEYAVAEWLKQYKVKNPSFQDQVPPVIPTDVDDIHVPGSFPSANFRFPVPGTILDPRSRIGIEIATSGRYPPLKTEVYMNGRYVMTSSNNPVSFSFVPDDVGSVRENNIISVIVYDTVFNKTQATTTFSVMPDMLNRQD